ncbi:MAG: hypothetical protein ACM30H_12205 [Clostridia bacterium]
MIAAALALASFAAGAQSFRCVGKDGKKYYGSSVPPQCVGVVVEQMSAQGTVLKRIEPQAASADERAKKEAEEAERKKQAATTREQQRRDQALLATYSSEKELEEGRRRALENDQRVVNELENKIAVLKKRRAAEKDTKVVDSELALQENALAARKKEIAAINARYDEDKKRYVELTGRGK